MNAEPLDVIVIDDDELVRDEICVSLRDHYNMAPRAMASAEDALALLEESKNGYRVVLSDIRMPPRMNGDKFLSEIRRRFPHIEVVLMTAYYDHDAAVRAVNEHAFHLLLKGNMEMKKVAEILKAAYRRSRIREERRLLVEAFEEWVTCLDDSDSLAIAVGDSSFTPGELLEQLKCGGEAGEEYLKMLLVAAVELVSGRLGLDGE